MSTSRPFNIDTDLADLHRIWQEIGWMEDSDAHRRGIKAYLDVSTTTAQDVNGAMDIGVSRCDATVHVQHTTLPACLIAGVYAGLAGRQGGHATRMTAEHVADGAAQGAAIATLGIFDQGFYDRVGFGCGPYVRRMTIEPASLNVPRLQRSPVRLTIDDAQAMHDCRLQRRHLHGAIDIPHVAYTEMECCESPGWGLGFKNSAGALTHCMWITHESKIENGPWSVRWMAWNTRDELMELLGVVKSFADQVSGVRIADPPGLQMQDLVDRPFAWMRRTGSGDNQVKPTAVAYWQHRMCDVPRCIGAISMPGADLRFNVQIDEPIEQFLASDASWRGCGGDWIISLGDTCSAEPGCDDALPTMRASINAFTRWWMGVRSAEALSMTDAFEAPAELLAGLTAHYRLPAPETDWDY